MAYKSLCFERYISYSFQKLTIILFFQKKKKFRAGHKLEAAIKEFGIICDGKIALDSGLSTGGFTDCLLQHGASHVYGVDVGYGQVNNYFFEII